MDIKFFIFFIFSLSFIALASASVVINEIMYDPSTEQGGDANGEWIEIYNGDSFAINLEGWIIKDKGSSNASLDGLLSAHSYMIIADNITNFNSVWNCSCIAVEGNFGLGNSGDEIWLWNQSSLVDYVNYGAISAEGNSLQLCNQSFIDDYPTPGMQNNCSQNQTNPSTPTISSMYPNSVYNNNTNFSIVINVLNFTQGNYDLKIDIKNSTKYLNRIWADEGWSSKNEWLENFISVNSSNQSFNTINIVDDEDYFVGNATMQIKLKNSTDTFSSSILNIPILNGTFQNSSANEEESEIRITDAPNDANFGDSIDIELNVYKGDTSKYAVYVYVEDGDGNKISDKITEHFNVKFSNQTTDVELLLKCENETGTYEIVAEGLDAEDREEIELGPCSENPADSGDIIAIGDFGYSMTVPNSINLGEEFAVKVKITSNAEQEQNFLVWSYVYSGNKCLSCGDDATRESNAKSITIEQGSTAEIGLQNVVEEAESGTYKLKIKVLQEGLKTPKEFTYDVKIESKQQSPSAAQNKSAQKNSDEMLTSNAISDIETKSFSLRNSLPYLLATVCALVAIYLTIKKI